MERIQADLDAAIKAAGLNHRDLSDGHHTYGELYAQRMEWHAFAANAAPKEMEAHKSKLHHDGKPCFGGGWFGVDEGRRSVDFAALQADGRKLEGVQDSRRTA